MNTINQKNNVHIRSAGRNGKRSAPIQRIGLGFVTLAFILVLLIPLPDGTYAGGGCSTTTGHCSISAELYETG